MRMSRRARGKTQEYFDIYDDEYAERITSGCFRFTPASRRRQLRDDA